LLPHFLATWRKLYDAPVEAPARGGLLLGWIALSCSWSRRLPRRGTYMRIHALMSQYIEVIHPDASITEAARTMRRADVGPLLVCNGERLVGILTDRDITVRVVAAEAEPQTTRVRDVMTSDVVYCFEDQEVQTAARLMARRQLRRLPVLNREQHLV